MGIRRSFYVAVKATYGEITSSKPKFLGDDNVEVEAREIFKDPVTDDGTKKSAKGLLQVYKDGSKIKLKDQCTWEEEREGMLQTVFLNGQALNITNLAEIRQRLNT